MVATLAMTTRRIPFAEVFPIRTDAVPTLYGYSLTVRGGDASTIGGKLAYRLRRASGGHWAVTHGMVVGDLLVPSTTLDQVTGALKGEQPEVFKALHQVSLDTTWKAIPQATAEFVARALFPDLHGRMTQVLAGLGQDLGQVRAERVYVVRGWVVADEPAVSLSITSRLVAKQPFIAFVRQARNMAAGDGLRGMWVSDASSSLKGQIAEVTGAVGTLRNHLLSLTQREEMRRLITRAPDDEPVVRVQVGRTSYEYPASALRTIVRTEDYSRFGIDARRASQALRIAPKDRADLVAKIAQVGKDAGLLAPNAYRGSAGSTGGIGRPAGGYGEGKTTRTAGTAEAPTAAGTIGIVGDIGDTGSASRGPLFLTAGDVGFSLRLRLGDGSIVMHDERSLPEALARHGLYRPVPTSTEGAALRVAVLNALAVPFRPLAAPFVESLRRELRRFNVETTIVAEELLDTPSQVSHLAIERAYETLAGTEPDLLLPLLPFTYAAATPSASARESGGPGDPGEASEWGVYQHLKSLAVGQGLPSQVVTQRSLATPYALGNIVPGVLGKTGAIPFVLAEPLSYADVVVGIDIARRRKDRLAGSMNATAIARVYLNDGDFLRYVIHDAPLEGETIPRDVLRRLFPLRDFQGKRVVIQRDGLFRGDEAAALEEWARDLGSVFHLVEVIKSGTPRLYASAGGRILQPEKGTALRLSDHEAFLVSSLPPFQQVTPNPLHLRTSANFPIEQAIHSVLALTLLHFGSLKSPRLPVTIHYSDEIAYLALQGIKPKHLEGRIPYWL